MDKSAESLLNSLQLVADVLQEQSKPEDALPQLAEIVKDHIHSDGAKIIVVQRGSEGPMLEQLCRTDREIWDRRLVPISQERGLADWVVLNNDWILVSKVDQNQEAAESNVPVLEAITGSNGMQRIEPRPEAEFIEDAKDDESTLLMVPMYVASKAAAAIAVWRKRQQPYIAQKDPDALQQIVPFVSATCRQVLQQRALQNQLEAVSQLANSLHQAERLDEVYGAVALGVGQLSSARFALLLHPDPKRRGRFYHRYTWSALADRGRLDGAFQGLQISCGDSPECWRDKISEQVLEQLQAIDGNDLTVRSDRILSLQEQGQKLPKLVVVLLDRKETTPSSYFADDLRDQAAHSFLAHADSLLTNHIQTYPQRLLSAIGGTEEHFFWEPNDILLNSARMLKDATGASGAMVYSGSPKSMSVTSSWPQAKDLEGLKVSRPSMTWRCIQSQKIQRVVDTDDPKDQRNKDLDRVTLGKIQAAFGWKNLRSWLCCPVVDQNRCIGVIKLLTADEDSFLGRDSEEVSEAVADRAAWEIHKINRRLMLEHLNKIASELAEERGSTLGNRMIMELGEWAESFVKPDTRVAVSTRISPDRTFINSFPPGVPDNLIEGLQTLSKQWGAKERTWAPRTTFKLKSGRESDKLHIRWACVAVPFQLPKPAYLQGHLILLNNNPFSNEEVEYAREAAREMGLVLNGERLRWQWTERISRFRHAVLGPLQGLTSLAKELAVVAENSGAEGSEIGELRSGILEEEEIIRLWRYNQRLYLQEDVEITPRNASLKNTFDRCARRFEAIFKDGERGLRLIRQWKSKGELRLSFDDKALDLAISNLLDNAMKYSFYHQTVLFGAEAEREVVKIWVEDTGHPIPERLTDDIYRTRRRLDWSDPFRTIAGEGLGLPMTKAVVEKHGGDLYHTCTPLTNNDSDTAPYQVRFTIELPWRT